MPSGPERPTNPDAVKVADDGMSEVYERPGLDKAPRTGRGLRSPGPEAPRAGEILAGWKHDEPSVVTPKKFQVFQGRDRPKDEGMSAQAHAAHAEAEVHASVDVSSAPDAVMSHSTAYGPTKTVVDEDPLASLRRPVPELPPLPDDEEETQTEAFPSVAPAAAAGPAAAVVPAAARHAAADAPGPTPVSPLSTTVRHESAPMSRPHVSHAPRPEPSSGPVCRVALVQAEFNLDITDAMAAAVHGEAHRLGTSVVEHVRVPGAYDTPLATQHLLKRDDVDGVVVVGCIIQGETGHDELIAHATAKSLQELALRFEKPVGLAITGPRMTEAQAKARIDAGAFALASVALQHRLAASS
jgi:6,7-dimethyl-8-ribityllumazine synthase